MPLKYKAKPKLQIKPMLNKCFGVCDGCEREGRFSKALKMQK